MKSLLLFIFSISLQAAEPSCKEVTMRRTQTSPVSEITVTICSKNKSEEFYSPNANLENIRKLDKEKFKTTPALGNPSFQLCRQLGGIPELIKIKKDGEWSDADRCLLPGGNSFVSGDLLVELLFPGP